MRPKFGRLLLAGCLLVLPAAAQRGGGGHGGGGFHGGGGGFHGGMGGGIRGGADGRLHGGNGGFRGERFRGGGFRGGSVLFGLPYSYGYPYDYGVYPYDPSSANPNYVTGYANGVQPGSCAQANGTPLYQIKLTYQDNIYLAQKYWYTPGTLNFITAQGEEKKTPINTIDPVTFQLNQSCGLNFTAPQ